MRATQRLHRDVVAALFALAACGQSSPTPTPYVGPGMPPTGMPAMPGAPGTVPAVPGYPAAPGVPGAFPAVPGYPVVPGVPAIPGVPVVPAAIAAECVVGHWEATDFLQMVRRSVQAGMRARSVLARASGNITLDFAPPDANRSGQLTVAANQLVHTLAMRQQGISISGSVTLNGSATMPYRLVGTDRFELQAATRNDLIGRAVVTTSLGIGGGAGGHQPLNMSGSYGLQCTPAELRFWELGPDGQRRGQEEIVLARATATP